MHAAMLWGAVHPTAHASWQLDVSQALPCWFWLGTRGQLSTLPAKRSREQGGAWAENNDYKVNLSTIMMTAMPPAPWLLVGEGAHAGARL